MDVGFLILLFSFISVFFLLIPGLGAFFVRSRWRKFRAALIASSHFPRITYADLRGGEVSEAESLGKFRFFGVLEAIQDDDVVWIRNGEIALSADMKGQRVYVLPSLSSLETEDSEELNELALPDEMPTMVAWDKMSTLPEGTRVFLSGRLLVSKGKGLFKAEDKGELLVVFFEGEEDSILRRAIWNGRHRNEYWNPFTPASLGGGVLSSLILGYIALKNPFTRIEAILALGAAIVPLVPLLPPGLIGFTLYRRFWNRARFLRAERDLVRLPLRFLPDEDVTKSFGLFGGETYVCSVLPAERFFAFEDRAKLRVPSMIRGRPVSAYYWFGVKDGDSPVPGKSSDPMIESVVVPGHPSELAAACERRARTLEFTSMLFFGAGFGTNLFIVLHLLSRIIR